MMKNTKKIKIDFFTIALIVFLVLFTISLSYLLFWSLITSFKTQDEFRLNRLGLPHDWTFFNFKVVIKNMQVRIVPMDGGMPWYANVSDMVINTLMYVIGCSLLQTLTPCLVAYAVSKFNFKFNIFIDALVMVVISLPIVGSSASELKLLRDLNLYDSMLGMWIQKTNFAGLYYFVFCATFKGVSKSYYEAAYIDGANEFVVMVIIGIPMVIYTFFAVFLLQFIAYWNDYQTIVLYLPSWPTLSYALFDLSQSTTQELNNTPTRMAAAMIIILPTLVIFSVFSKQLMGNISMGGVKE